MNLQFDGSVLDSFSTYSPIPNRAYSQVGYSHSQVGYSDVGHSSSLMHIFIHRLVIQAYRLVTHRLVTHRLVIHRLAMVTHHRLVISAKVRYNQPAKSCRLGTTAKLAYEAVLTNLHLGVQVGYQAGWLSQVIAFGLFGVSGNDGVPHGASLFLCLC